MKDVRDLREKFVALLGAYILLFTIIFYSGALTMNVFVVVLSLFVLCYLLDFLVNVYTMLEKKLPVKEYFKSRLGEYIVSGGVLGVCFVITLMLGK